MDIIKLNKDFLIKNTHSFSEITRQLKLSIKSRVGTNRKYYRDINNKKDKSIKTYNEFLKKLVENINQAAVTYYNHLKNINNIAQIIHQIKKENLPDLQQFTKKIELYGKEACEEWNKPFKKVLNEIKEIKDPQQTANNLNNWESTSTATRDKIEENITKKIEADYNSIYNKVKKLIDAQMDIYIKHLSEFVDYVINNQNDFGFKFLEYKDSILLFCEKVKNIAGNKRISLTQNDISQFQNDGWPGFNHLPSFNLTSEQSNSDISKWAHYIDFILPTQTVNVNTSIRIINFISELNNISSTSIKSSVDLYSNPFNRKSELGKKLQDIISPKISGNAEDYIPICNLHKNYHIKENDYQILEETIKDFLAIRDSISKGKKPSVSLDKKQIEAANVIIEPLYDKKYDPFLKAIYKTGDVIAKLIIIFHENMDNPEKAANKMLEAFEKKHPDKNYTKYKDAIPQIIENIIKIKRPLSGTSNIKNSNKLKSIEEKFENQASVLFQFSALLQSIKNNDESNIDKTALSLDWNTLQKLLSKGNWETKPRGPSLVLDADQNTKILNALDAFEELGLNKNLNDEKIETIRKKIFSEIYEEIDKEVKQENDETKKKAREEEKAQKEAKKEEEKAAKKRAEGEKVRQKAEKEAKKAEKKEAKRKAREEKKLAKKKK